MRSHIGWSQRGPLGSVSVRTLGSQEADIGQCAGENVRSSTEVECEIPHWLEPTRTLGP